MGVRKSDPNFYHFFKVYISKAVKGEFFKNLFTLGTGTIIAQLIPVLASPILTRIYTPDQFGILGNFMAVLAILLVFYTGKFELAIILPKTNEEAINIVSLTFLIICFFTLISFVILIASGKALTSFLNIIELTDWLWLIPVAAFFASTYLVINEWYVRKNNFIGLSKNKITNTGGITSNSLLFGFFNLNIGLILGQITGQLFSVLFAVLRFSKYDRSLLAYVSLKKMKYFARKHINFSKFIIPAQFINTIAGQAPIFILTSQFGLTEAGLLAFTNRILGVPMNFIGNAFRDVFKQRAALDYKKNGNCIDIYKKVTFTLLGISIIPFVILFITAPFLFSFFFGEEWYQAGVYARVLCVMYFISFVSMPTGWIFVIAEKQKLDFLWQIIFLIFTIVPLIIGVILKDVFMTIVFLGIGRSISYTIQLFMTYRLAKGKH